MGAGQPPLKEKAKKETHRKAVRFSVCQKTMQTPLFLL